MLTLVQALHSNQHRTCANQAWGKLLLKSSNESYKWCNKEQLSSCLGLGGLLSQNLMAEAHICKSELYNSVGPPQKLPDRTHETEGWQTLSSAELAV